MENDARPVLIGMNNPHGSDPKYALYPYPEHSAGGRLQAMFRSAYLARYNLLADTPTRQKYLDGFDRRNVLASARWDAAMARRQGAELAKTLPGRRVVILGRKTADALGVPKLPWFDGGRQVVETGNLLTAFTCWTLPHPSRLCQEYNNPLTRQRAGELLLALYEGRDP